MQVSQLQTFNEFSGRRSHEVSLRVVGQIYDRNVKLMALNLRSQKNASMYF
jgi:hypothetical protein